MTAPIKKGDAWILDTKTNKYKRPAQPTDGKTYRWDDNKGWVSTEQQATNWGLALAVINSDPSLSALFDKAWQSELAGTGWDELKFKTELKGTSWYQSRSASQQELFTLKNDPARQAEYQARIDANKSAIQSAATTAGANLTEAELTTLAEENLTNNWNTTQLQSALAKYVSFTKDTGTGTQSLTGTAGDIENNLRNYASDMGIKVDDAWILDQVQKSIGSGSNINGALDWIKERAKEKYATWAEDLSKSDTTIKDLSFNYRSSMANILELPDAEVTAQDPLIQQAMMTGDGKGNKVTVFDFEKSLRQDPRWAKTKNAKESTQSVVNNILSTFGLA